MDGTWRQDLNATISSIYLPIQVFITRVAPRVAVGDTTVAPYMKLTIILLQYITKNSSVTPRKINMGHLITHEGLYS